MVGDFWRFGEPCVEASIEQNMSSISHIVPEILTFGILNLFVQRLGDNSGGGVVTDGWAVFMPVFVG